MEASPPPSPPPPPPPPQPPTSQPIPSPYETEIATRVKVQRSKLIWRMFMIANLGLGAVMFFKAKQRDLAEKYYKAQLKVEQPPPPAPPPPQSPSNASLLDYDYEPDIVPSSPNSEPLFVREPISNDQKREVFQWMLEEKRRIQPKDREEERGIDQDKAVLKQFIRAESMPPM